MKTFFIKTYGCYANIADSSQIEKTLISLGYLPLNVPKFKTETEENKYVIANTDIFVINTCSVRQKSEDKVYGLGKVFPKVKRKPFVILAGCMVGSVTGDRIRYPMRELISKTPWADTYLAPNQIEKLPEILGENKFKEVPFENKGEKHAFVNLSFGCDNFCTYCVVPYSREREISRSENEIIKEINDLVKNGFTEFTLCGQNVNSWGLSKEEKFNVRLGSNQTLPFAGLLRKIHDIKGVEKISFMSSNPFDFTQDLIEVLKLEKMQNYVHIAVQSGNNEILKKMNRRHTVEEYVNLIEKIRRAKPNIEIGTDIIVGFPGETEAQFMDTIGLLKQIRFNVIFGSMYSPRKGTYADTHYKNDVSHTEKKRRLDILIKTWKEHKV